jgi:transcriptional regulator with XRE-family HTH domain
MLHQFKKRKKTRNESLVRLRDIIGMTQREFALLVGISLDLVKGIESGRNKLSRIALQRIFMATGVDRASLDEGDGMLLYLTRVEEYTKEHFDDWNCRMFPSNKATVWEEFESIVAPHMLLLMLAATRQSKLKKVKDRLPALLTSWSDWEREALDNFDLEPQINEILEQLPLSMKETMTWGDWRKKVAFEAENYKRMKEKDPKSVANIVPDFTKRWWKFQDNPKKPDNEMLTLTCNPKYEFRGGLTGMKEIFEKLKATKDDANAIQ